MRITLKTKCDNCKRTLKNKRIIGLTIFEPCSHILCNKCELKVGQVLDNRNDYYITCRICYIENRATACMTSPTLDETADIINSKLIKKLDKYMQKDDTFYRFINKRR